MFVQQPAIPQQQVTPQQPMAAPQQLAPTPQLHFDYTALVNRVKPSHSPIFWLILLVSVVVGVGILILGGSMLGTSDGLGTFLMIFGTLLAALPAAIYANTINKKTMKIFAATNGIVHQQKIFSLESFGYNWMINQIQNLEIASITEKIMVANRSFSEIGNISFSVRKTTFMATVSKEPQIDSYAWSYVRIVLPRAVPRIILDSLKNDGLLSTNKLPLKIDKGQKLSLEGGLDNYFALYAPLDYAQDAYYIFRPEVLTMLANMAQAYDLELIGTDLFVYRHRPVRFTHYEDIEEMANVADALQRAFYETTKNYKNSFNDVLTDEQKAVQGQSLQAQ